MANKSDNKKQEKSIMSYLPTFTFTISTANVLKAAVVVCLIYLILKMVCNRNKLISANLPSFNTSSPGPLPIIGTGNRR